MVRYYSLVAPEPEPARAPTGEPHPSADRQVDGELDQTREALEEPRSEVASLREEVRNLDTLRVHMNGLFRRDPPGE